MSKNPGTGIFCLSLIASLTVVAWFLGAAPTSRTTTSSDRSELSGSTHLTRAEQVDAPVDLTSDRSAVCAETPKSAERAIETQARSEGHGFMADRRSAVLSMIDYPWEKLGFKVFFMNARPGYRAMTLTSRNRIEVYVRPGEALDHQAFDLAHELGHAFDLVHNNEQRRKKWRELRGIDPSTPWFGCDACPDYGTPAGDFAETFAALLLGPGNYHSRIASLPRPEQAAELAAFCMIERPHSAFAAPARPDVMMVAAPSVAPAKAEKLVRKASTEAEITRLAAGREAEPAPAESTLTVAAAPSIELINVAVERQDPGSFLLK